MGIRKYKPTTPGRRFSSVSDFVEITRDTPEKSLEHMHQAFVDGLFRVFADGEELTQWEGPLALHEDSELVFIRFTMLTGLCWRMIF